jgi:EF hand
MGETLFSRYIREMVHAVDLNNDGMISEDELLHMMEHIGIERALTPTELQTLFEELGEGVAREKQIATYAVEELVLRRLHEFEMKNADASYEPNPHHAVA